MKEIPCKHITSYLVSSSEVVIYWGTQAQVEKASAAFL